MSLSKQVLDDINHKEYEEPVYGAPDEAFRQFEEVYGIAWPSREELDQDADEEC